MTKNDSLFGNIMHKGIFDWGNLESRFISKVPGQNLGYKIQAEIPLSTRQIVSQLTVRRFTNYPYHITGVSLMLIP
ncbi:MAG: hypothetical protein PHG00_15600 [Methylococcales bacterium]|nr:hypothetical protein [Methylococcales bacterium]